MSPLSALERVEASLSELAGTEVELERPSDPTHGEYATSVALRLAGQRKRPPRELAEELSAAAAGLPQVERAEVAGPGFVNLWLTRDWYGEALGEMLGAGTSFGAARPDARQRIQVEMVSANPTGPIPVSAGRNAAYGDAVARLLDLAGHEVEREYYYNDAGLQIERFRASVEARRRGRSRPRTATRVSTSWPWPSWTATRFPRCLRRSRRRSSASASTSTRGRCRASSSSGYRS